MAYLIKGAHVYNPDNLGVQDVLVVNDKIAAVGKDLTLPAKSLHRASLTNIFTLPVAAGKAVRAAVRLKSFSVN